MNHLVSLLQNQVDTVWWSYEVACDAAADGISATTMVLLEQPNLTWLLEQPNLILQAEYGRFRGRW